MAPVRSVGSLDAILALQDGIVARPQLRAAAVEDVTIYRKIRGGEWQRVLPGVYRIVPGVLTFEHRRIAAALYAGERAQLTGAAALLWYGFRSPLATDRIQALIPHELHRRSAGFVVVQRAIALDDRARDAGMYRLTSVPRAVIDACRHSSDLQVVRAVMTEAVQRSLTSVDQLDREIRRAARSRTALASKVLAEISDGARSAPEAELKELLAPSTVLPRIQWNPQLVGPDGTLLPTPDGWIADGGIALEVDSKTYHEPEPGWDRTLARSNVLTALGATVLHLTPREIRTEPARVRRLVENTYRHRAGWRGPIHVKGGSPS